MRKYFMFVTVVLLLAFTSQAVADPYPGGAQYLTGWGNNDEFQTTGTVGAPAPDRVPPAMANPAEKVYTDWAGGGWYSYALKADGTLQGWSDVNPHISAHLVPPGNDFVKISGSLLSAAALRSNGVVELWGLDTDGQASGRVDMGSPDTDWPVYATVVDPHGGYTDVGGSVWTVLAVDGSGMVTGWGLDNFGQVTSAPAGTDYVEVACSAGTGIARKLDGTLAAWGLDDHALVTGAPMVGGNIVQIDAGDWHAAALRGTDGAVIAWGANTFNACGPGGDPAMPTVLGLGYVGVATGAWCTVGLHSDGHIDVWGDPFVQSFAVPGGYVYNHLGEGGSWHFAALADVPEPATIMLLGLGGLALIRRRRA